jgi:hypothetical protein
LQTIRGYQTTTATGLFLRCRKDVNHGAEIAARLDAAISSVIGYPQSAIGSACYIVGKGIGFEGRARVLRGNESSSHNDD